MIHFLNSPKITTVVFLDDNEVEMTLDVCVHPQEKRSSQNT